MANVNANKIIMPNGNVAKLLADNGIVNITRNGLTFTATRQDGTTFTFTQQDNNTTTGTTYTAGNVPNNTTFGTNGSIKNVYDNLKGRLDGTAQAYSSAKYNGNIGANGYCPNTVTLPAGKWLITTQGYVASGGAYQPFGLGLSSGAQVHGMQPVWFVNLSTSTKIYIWNIISAQISAANLVIAANRIGV